MDFPPIFSEEHNTPPVKWGIFYSFSHLYLFVHFFCSSKRNEPKKKRPEMTTTAKTGACYTGLNGATVLAVVRTISGLPSRYHN
jgi:hypothetical protein